MDNVEVIVRASARHNRRDAARMASRIIADIGEAGGFPIREVEAPSRDALVAVLVLTGGVEREVLKLVSQLPSPNLLIAHSGHNSLPAALEILARLRQDGGEGRILFGSPETIASELTGELSVSSAWQRLRFSRIGVIGDPSEWLVASHVDRAFVKGRLGIELVEIDLETLIERIGSASPSRHDVARLVKGSSSPPTPTKDKLKQAVAIYAGLRSLIEEHRLAACTVRCFDLLQHLENTSCYALSRLNDERVPAACEGDLQALFSLYLGVLISDRPALMGNLASVETNARSVTVAHCTCPLSLGSSYAVLSHFESDLGVGLDVDVPPGPCTLFRLGGERLDHLFVRQGTITGDPGREDLCRTQVLLSVDDEIDELLTAPLGNHHILLVGHHADTITRFFERYLHP